MIQVIGFKRLIILFILISINIILGVGVYLYMIPQSVKDERQLRNLRMQTNVVSADIDRMQIEFEQLDRQRDSFNALKDDGFFSTQARSDAKELFSYIQEESKVISAVVSLKSGVILNYPEAKKANHSVLMSPVEVEINAFDDASVYRYMDIALKTFPGHLSFDSINIQRMRDVSSPVLRAIAAGANPALVKASLKMSWRTVIPTSQVIPGKKF